MPRQVGLFEGKPKTPRAKARKASTWEAIFERMQALRVAELEIRGQSAQPEEVAPATVNAVLARVDAQIRALAGAAYSDPESDVLQVWNAYLTADRYGFEQCSPPFALAHFAAPVTLEKARKVAAAAFAEAGVL